MQGRQSDGDNGRAVPVAPHTNLSLFTVMHPGQNSSQWCIGTRAHNVHAGSARQCRGAFPHAPCGASSSRACFPLSTCIPVVPRETFHPVPSRSASSRPLDPQWSSVDAEECRAGTLFSSRPCRCLRTLLATGPLRLRRLHAGDVLQAAASAGGAVLYGRGNAGLVALTALQLCRAEGRRSFVVQKQTSR